MLVEVYLLQRMGGIEPLTQAWEAGVLPLNYIRVPLLYHPGGGMSRSMGKFFRSRSVFLPTGSDLDPEREADAADRLRGCLPEIRNPNFISPDTLLRVKGLEPSRSCPHKNLNLARLPIPPHPRVLFFRTVLLYLRVSVLSRGFGKNLPENLRFFRAGDKIGERGNFFEKTEIRSGLFRHGMGERG